MLSIHDRFSQGSHSKQYDQPHLVKNATPPMHHPVSHSAPYLSYFISRTNGPLVPLIPADELPFNVRLQGVPRVLTFDQTYGMQHVGTAPYTGQVFKQDPQSTTHPSISQPGSSATPEHSLEAGYSTPYSHHRGASGENHRPFTAPDALVRKALGHPSSPTPAFRHVLPERPTTESASSAATSWRRPASEPVDKTQAVIDAILESDPAAAARTGYVPKGAPPPSGKIPDSDKKEYCTYWMRTGECDYIQQGCLYKHEMPDREMLAKLGFRTVPRWWQERNAIKMPDAKPMLVGDGKKPHEWLKARETTGGKGTFKDSDSGSDSDSSVESGKGKVTTMQKPTILKRPIPAVKSQPVDSITTTKKKESATEKVTSSEDRKASIANSDLIDFQPLLPTPPSSATSVSPPPSTTSSGSKKTNTPTSDAKDTSPSSSGAKSSKKSKIFVPAGESPDHHIADHHSRKRVPRASPNVNPSSHSTNHTSQYTHQQQQAHNPPYHQQTHQQVSTHSANPNNPNPNNLNKQPQAPEPLRKQPQPQQPYLRVPRRQPPGLEASKFAPSNFHHQKISGETFSPRSSISSTVANVGGYAGGNKTVHTGDDNGHGAMDAGKTRAAGAHQHQQATKGKVGGSVAGSERDRGKGATRTRRAAVVSIPAGAVGVGASQSGKKEG
ncbi:hypothetical protein MBLNU230_g3849t1 [Neophaeotheca triangularis]